MSKGSGGTRGSSWRDNQNNSILSSYNFRHSDYSDSPSQLGGGAVKQLVSKMGSSDADIDAAFKLIQKHSDGYGTSEDQAKIDEQIYQIINDPKNSIGKALRNIAVVNEAHYKSWVAHQKDRIAKAKTAPINPFSNEAIEYASLTDPEYGGMNHKQAMKEIISDRIKGISTDIKIYRGGGEKNAESWTSDSRGANTGNGVRIKPTKSSSLNEKRKTHYILGGISQMVGAPGEAEIFLVKRKR